MKGEQELASARWCRGEGGSGGVAFGPQASWRWGLSGWGEAGGGRALFFQPAAPGMVLESCRAWPPLISSHLVHGRFCITRPGLSRCPPPADPWAPAPQHGRTWLCREMGKLRPKCVELPFIQRCWHRVALVLPPSSRDRVRKAPGSVSVLAWEGHMWGTETRPLTPDPGVKAWLHVSLLCDFR